MIQLTITSAADARLAAELCDFLAERMEPGAPPAKRTRRTKAEIQAEQPTVTQASDPVELYAKLSGATLVDVPAEHIITTVTEAADLSKFVGTQPEPEPAAVLEPVVTPAEPAAPDIETLRAAAREAGKTRGGAWWGAYHKQHHPDGRKLSEFNAEQLQHVISTAAEA